MWSIACQHVCMLNGHEHSIVFFQLKMLLLKLKHTLYLHMRNERHRNIEEYAPID